MEASVDELKLSLIEIILKVKDPILLSQIEDFIIANLPCALPIITDEEYANSIRQALKETEEDKTITMEELEEDMKNW